MPPILSRLNPPGDGPYPFTEDLRAAHLRVTFSGNYATGGYPLNGGPAVTGAPDPNLNAMYGIKHIAAILCHGHSWMNSLTADAQSQKLCYCEWDATNNKMVLRQVKANSNAYGDPEVGNGLSVADVAFDITVLGI